MALRWGSRKRKRKSERQDQTEAARAARHPEDQDEDGYLSSEKENDESVVVAAERARGDEFKRKFDNSAKRARYWAGKADKLEEKVEGLEEQNEVMQEELTKQEKDIRSQRDVIERLEDQVGNLKEDKARLQKDNHSLKQKIRRIPDRLSTVLKRVTRVFSRKQSSARAFHMKEKGVITDETRSILTDLVSLDDVPEKRVVQVFKRIAGAFGVDVMGDVHRRSVGRITKEGGNASVLQFMDATKQAEGVTLSGDGTTHKNETHETKYATVNQDRNNRLQFFLGLKTAVNHTSETQRDGWIELVEEMYHLAFESGMVTEDDARQFWNLVTGFHSDHAEDQKKLFRLLKEWKAQCDRELRGERAERKMSDLEHAIFVLQCSQEAVRRVGGPQAWDLLSSEQRTHHIDATRREFVRNIGQVEYDALPEEERSEIDFFLWAGCCMHKEMNAFKGGCAGMDAFWEKNPHLDEPKKMFNRDNAATVELAPDTAASKRAEERTKGGAVKVASLCGAIFRHKDRKRGQQDSLRFFFDHELGFVISFPDTSNTRFQSHAEACAVLITYLDLFIKFLGYVKENKASRSLNHMEKNVWDGLHCSATRHEICVITLYYLAVSVPYMREIRGPYRAEENVLLLGPLHQRVVKFIDTLIEEPERLIGEEASYQKGSFDGKLWERPEAFYAVQKHAANLPHLRNLLVAFLKAAKDVWIRFSAEYSAEGAISKATPDQIEKAWMESTNDLCEGSFATFRQSSKRNPTMSLAQYNARKMYKFNKTSAYLRSLSPEMRKFLRRITREKDESGANRRTKLELAAYKQKVAEENVEKARVAAEKKQAIDDAIDRVVPIVTMEELNRTLALATRAEGYMKVNELEMQLLWHRKHGPAAVKELIPSTAPSSWGNRGDKIMLLKGALEKHIALGLSLDAPGTISNEEDAEDFDLDVTVDDLDGFDSEEDYYD